MDATDRRLRDRDDVGRLLLRSLARHCENPDWSDHRTYDLNLLLNVTSVVTEDKAFESHVKTASGIRFVPIRVAALFAAGRYFDPAPETADTPS